MTSRGLTTRRTTIAGAVAAIVTRRYLFSVAVASSFGSPAIREKMTSCIAWIGRRVFSASCWATEKMPTAMEPCVAFSTKTAARDQIRPLTVPG